MEKDIKCCIIVYGCSKNYVDAEEMVVRLEKAGYGITGDPTRAQVVIVHTCGFIEPAKKESIDGILEACNTGENCKVLVTGCLSQRYPHQLFDEIPEVAGVVGTSAPRDIVSLVERVILENRICITSKAGRDAPGCPGLSRIKPDKPWAYLRISEGCRHRCTYCAIPYIRGPLASRPMTDIINEARYLAGHGVVELNLIAQDLSDYGFDLSGRSLLPELVESLCDVSGIQWIRLLYVRPDGVNSALAKAMTHPKVVPYIDLPMEHGSEKILRRMGRPGLSQIREAVEILREHVPDIYIRTTIILGFPGETPEDIEETLEFLVQMKVHRVAAFPYSREEGTPAYGLENTVPPETGFQRAEIIRRFGISLARRNSELMLGKSVPLLLTKPSIRKGYWLARGLHQAPEVDGRVYVKSNRVNPGLITGKVTRTAPLDLWAKQTD